MHFRAVFFYVIIACMDVVQANSASEWNNALASIPNAHVLQTWEWGEIKAGVGWTPARLLFGESGRPCAAAQILRRALPRTPFGVLYVPKGPAFDYRNPGTFELVLDSLESYARLSRSIFVKVDPDIPLGAEAASSLKKRGWLVSSEQIQFRNSVILDLTGSEQSLFEAMKPKWRYNIRLAEKRGVRVELGTEKDLPLFYNLYAETGNRDGFLVRRFPYYRSVWGTMLQSGFARLLLAKVGSETVAGLVLFVFADRGWYFYGASSSKRRDLMPNHLLQWEAIRWTKAHGCREYDFWGAPDKPSENDAMYGVYKFKLGFGGRLVERIAAHDFVIHPRLYWLYTVVRPKYLAGLRRRHKTQLGADG